MITGPDLKDTVFNKRNDLVVIFGVLKFIDILKIAVPRSRDIHLNMENLNKIE